MTRYDPFREDPACIDSFFFGCCVLHFRGPWRQWLTARRRRRLEATVGLEALEDPADPGPDPAWRAVTLVEAERGLAALDERLRSSVALDAMGFTGPQSARRLVTTPKAVEGRLRRANQAFAQMRDNGGRAA